MEELFAAIRAACPRGLWAQGVKLARGEAVFAERTSAAELVLRVRSAGATVAPTVVLYLNDDEWDCNCGSSFDACAHVAAAVIVAQRAAQAGETVPSLGESGRQLGYAFTSANGRLTLTRTLGDDVLTGSLLDVDDAHCSEDDLTVDGVVRSAQGNPLGQVDFATILAALDGLDHVTLAGKPVYASGDPVMPLGVIRDNGRGVELEVVASPAITEVVGSGVVLCGDTLRPLAHTEITGELLEHLPFGKTVAKAGFAELVTDTIPQLEVDIPIDIRTTRLPEITTAVAPRIALSIEQGKTLSVLPTLEYGVPPIARIDGDRMVHLRGPAPIRDRARERELIAELRDYLNLVPGRRVNYSGNDAIRVTDKLHAWRGQGADRAAPGFVLAAPLMPTVDLSDGFDLSFASEDESGARRSAPAKAVIGAWQSGLELVPLDGGGWAPLPAGWLELHGDRVADLLDARAEDGSLPRFALPDLAAFADELELPRPPLAATVSSLLDDFDGIPKVDLPEDFRGELRPYQSIGVDWLSYMRDAELGAVLADDMGLGKTVQALCALRGRTLVVCPTSVLPTWANEIARFRPGLTVCLYHGPRRELDESADVTLTTYAILRIDSKRLTAIDWNTAILDEAQMIKNHSSQVAHVAHRLNADFRLTMSGTPVENRLDELWSQFEFVNRGLLGDRAKFQRRYARPIARGEAGAIERLRARIRPFLLRRLKAEVEPQLPPRTDAIIHCELDDDERVVYDAIRAATREDIVAKLREGGSVMAALEALLRLRQAACHRSLVPGQSATSSAKLRELLAVLDRVVAAGHRALVFSQWTSFLDLVEPHLKEAELDFVRLDGSTRNRGAVVDAFQSDDGPPVMLVSLKAGGTGLTLTAADHVFLLDPWWNPAVEDQAADRTHRIGQDRPVMVYRLVAIDTVETRILALQDKKRAVADAALGGANHAGGLTREDLLGLLD